MHIMDKTIKFLEDAKYLISDKDRWCKDNFATYLSYDQSKTSTFATNKKACQWCASGAMVKTFADHYNDKYRLIKDKADVGDAGFIIQAVEDDLVFAWAMTFLASVVDENGFRNAYLRVYDFNDNKETTHEDVIKAFDNAITELIKRNDSLDRKRGFPKKPPITTE